MLLNALANALVYNPQQVQLHLHAFRSQLDHHPPEQERNHPSENPVVSSAMRDFNIWRFLNLYPSSAAKLKMKITKFSMSASVAASQNKFQSVRNSAFPQRFLLLLLLI